MRNFLFGISILFICGCTGNLSALVPMNGNSESASSVVGLNPTSPPMDTITDCAASDVPSLQNCVNSVNRRAAQQITIHGKITCNATDNCGFAFNGITNNILVIGQSSESGITRLGGYNAPLFTLMNSTGPIAIRNLILNEGPANVPGGTSPGQPAGSPWRTNFACTGGCPYAHTIDIANSQNILIENVQFLNSKYAGVHLTASRNVTIRSSTFRGAWFVGVWSEYKPQTNPSVAWSNSGVHIENNQFLDLRVGAVVLSVSRPDVTNPNLYNTISGNYISHTQYAAFFYTDATPSRPIGGGQVAVERNSDYVWVDNNTVTHGTSDEDPSITQQASIYGIEVAPTNVSNVYITNNSISDETGSPLRVDATSSSDTQNVNLYGNKAARNTASPFILSSGWSPVGSERTDGNIYP